MRSFIKSRDSPAAMEAKKILFTRGGKSMNILKKSFSVFICVWKKVSSFLFVKPFYTIIITGKNIKYTYNFLIWKQPDHSARCSSLTP